MPVHMCGCEGGNCCCLNPVNCADVLVSLGVDCAVVLLSVGFVPQLLTQGSLSDASGWQKVVQQGLKDPPCSMPVCYQL